MSVSIARCPACGYVNTSPGHLIACCEISRIQALADQLTKGTPTRTRDLPAPAPWPGEPAPAAANVAIMTDLRVSVERHDLAMCDPCWDEKCDLYEACQGPPCACACQDWRTP